ncbi:hypothetical protein [Cytophaga aurantiaca]|uniref:hypothetical protein n=1 Tax=Cytophaga aurantiaca TaxID=29530 RepID=UPI0004767365|nr:hypothetical protein [Cytophaga aurantiaca]
MKNSTKVKLLEWSIAAVFLLLLFTSHFNFPPSSYFISLYCDLFNTDEYSPMLIASLLSLLYALPVYFIKERIRLTEN